MEGVHKPGSGFRKLYAWQRADDLLAEIYRLTEEVLDARHRWLGLQIIRAAFSVTSNIAEGYGRSSLGDYIRFLEMAGASLNEVENALHAMRRNKIVPLESLDTAESLRKESGNLLFGLSRALWKKLKTKGDWQRGLIKESPLPYKTEADEFVGHDVRLFEEQLNQTQGTDLDPIMFQVPGSQFQEERYG
jgi:four helix bundle protein